MDLTYRIELVQEWNRAETWANRYSIKHQITYRERSIIIPYDRVLFLLGFQ
jgi:hypothetical protein